MSTNRSLDYIARGTVVFFMIQNNKNRAYNQIHLSGFMGHHNIPIKHRYVPTEPF